MKTSGTNRRIRILLTAIKSGALVPRPEFQRRLVWNNKHKQEFITTVLMEYPFPEIYIAAGSVDPNTGDGTEMLVDGQQRITTLVQYFTGSPDFKLGDLRPYSQLSDPEKIKFLEYEVVVRDLGSKSIEEIKEVFRRINSTKYSLNAMEIHNARFDGAFKQFGETLTQNAFFERHGVFKTVDVRRMGDLVFCLSLTITVMSTYFNRDDDLEGYLAQYNDEFPEGDGIQDELNTVFSFLDSCNVPEDSKLWKKADLFTVLVELHRALIREGKTLNPEIAGFDLKNFFERVAAAGAGGPANEKIMDYYKASLQATNDRSNRFIRGKVIQELLSYGPSVLY